MNRNPGAVYAFGAFTTVVVTVLLIAAVITSSFNLTDKLLLLAAVFGLCGASLAMLARSTP